jgi:HK97 family phage major capsid protein
MSTTTYLPPAWTPQTVLPVNGIVPGDKPQPRYRPYNRIGKLRAFADEQTAFDCGQWLKAVVAREIFRNVDRRAEDYCDQIGLEVSNASTEGSGVTGGYVVPAPLAATLINVRERVGVARQVCQVLPMSSDMLSVLKKTGGLTVYFPAESSTITESNLAFGQVALAAIKRAVLTQLSSELVDDAIISIVDAAVSEMGYSLALQEDNELVNGTGASTYGNVQGLLSKLPAGGVSTAATNHNTWGLLDMADMMAAVGKLPDRYHVYGPSWICSHSFFNQVMARLAYAAGGVTMNEIMSGTPNVRSFAGYPVYLSATLPVATATSTVCALFGSFSQAVLFGDRGGVRIGRDDSIGFKEDVVTLRATSRYDMNVHDYGTASVAGAYVGLSTNS